MTFPTSKIISLVFLGVLSSGWYDTMTLELPAHLAKAGNAQFLTNVSLTVTLVYLIVDLVGVGSPGLRRNWHHLAANLELMVTTCYWTLIFVFPHLLNTDSFEFDLALDLKIHLSPYLFLVWDRKPGISFARSVTQSSVFLALYWSAIELYMYLSRHDGITRFPYPMVNDDSLGGRLPWVGMFMVVAAANWPVERALSRLGRA